MTERVKVKDEPQDKAAKKGDLHSALEDSFPASDPPAMTQPIKTGSPKDPAKDKQAK